MDRTLLDLFPISTRVDSTGSLEIAGCRLQALARKWGTPLYLYDAATVRTQVETLRAHMTEMYPASQDITYAAKTYFSQSMAEKLRAEDLGVDVVSLGELAMARRAGFQPGRVHLHGNNKSEAELEFAVNWGVQAIVVDSLEELHLLESVCERLGKPARIWLRVTPGLHVNTHAYRQTAHPASKFGLPISDGQAGQGIRRARSSRWLQLTGLHTHLGSHLFEVEPYQRAIELLMDLAEKEKWIPEELSPGGGWGVPYTIDDPDGDPKPWIEGVTRAVKDGCKARNWPLPKLLIEPGRLIVGKAGVAVYSVGTTKLAGDGTWFVAVDGGMADNLRPALYQARYTACKVDAPLAAQTIRGALVGKFCESGDQLIPEVMLPEVQRGDLIAMPVAGAYHLAMSSNYNLAPRPAVLWLDQGQVEVMQPREEPHLKGWWLGE